MEWSLIFAFALVILVIYLSLGKISEAIIPSMALPMSLLGFLLLTVAGLTAATIVSVLLSATPLAPTLGARRRRLLGSRRVSSGSSAR